MYQRNLAIGAVAVVAVLGGAVAVSHKMKASKDVTVAIESVQNGSTAATTIAQGTVAPYGLANVTVLPSFTAVVDKVLVNIGDRVQKGQPLAVLDPVDESDSLAQRLDAVNSSSQAYDLALHPYIPQQFASQRAAIRRLKMRSMPTGISWPFCRRARGLSKYRSLRTT